MNQRIITNDEPKHELQKSEVCNFQYNFIMLKIFLKYHESMIFTFIIYIIVLFSLLGNKNKEARIQVLLG